MKNIIFLIYLSLLGFPLFFTGCTSFKAPVVPPIAAFSTVSSPYKGVVDKSIGFKVGEAQCNCILSLFSFGDCSVKAAAQNGNLEKVDYISYDFVNILGLYSSVNTKAYGGDLAPETKPETSQPTTIEEGSEL